MCVGMVHMYLAWDDNPSAARSSLHYSSATSCEETHRLFHYFTLGGCEVTSFFPYIFNNHALPIIFVQIKIRVIVSGYCDLGHAKIYLPSHVFGIQHSNLLVDILLFCRGVGAVLTWLHLATSNPSSFGASSILYTRIL